MHEIEVIANGTPVKIDKDIQARTRRIEIRGTDHSLVSYECAWFDGRTRKVSWLESDEFKPENPKMVKVRFK